MQFHTLDSARQLVTKSTITPNTLCESIELRHKGTSVSPVVVRNDATGDAIFVHNVDEIVPWVLIDLQQMLMPSLIVFKPSSC